MTAPTPHTDRRRFRLATNHIETVVIDRPERRRFRLGGNHIETIVIDR